jgi:hypothetical protein
MAEYMDDAADAQEAEAASTEGYDASPVEQ